jgi:hypothetical protein
MNIGPGTFRRFGLTTPETMNDLRDGKLPEKGEHREGEAGSKNPPSARSRASSSGSEDGGKAVPLRLWGSE